MDFGWKKKAERLRMVLLSAGHQLAKELPPTLSKVLEIFRRAATSGDASEVQREIDEIEIAGDDGSKLLWEPVEIYGWKIEATFYLLNNQLWWLLHAMRKNEKTPSDKDIVFLDKILTHLGADPKRDMIIAPGSSPVGQAPLPFGWWTWFNRSPLYEIHVNKNKKPNQMVRIVPLGAVESDGYQSVDMPDDKMA